MPFSEATRSFCSSETKAKPITRSSLRGRIPKTPDVALPCDLACSSLNLRLNPLRVINTTSSEPHVSLTSINSFPSSNLMAIMPSFL